MEYGALRPDGYMPRLMDRVLSDRFWSRTPGPILQKRLLFEPDSCRGKVDLLRGLPNWTHCADRWV